MQAAFGNKQKDGIRRLHYAVPFERECFIKIVWFYFAENEPANLNCEQKF